MGRPGRPTLEPERRKSKAITVKATHDEWADLQQRAAARSMALGPYLLAAGLGRRLPRPAPQLNREARRELGRIGVNLNQAVRLAHEGRLPEGLELQLTKLRALLLEVREQLAP